MATKRKFKRDYIILESKDMNFRYKERVLPKAFAKIEINDDKATVALYVENLKFVKEGYEIVAIQSDYETIELGNIIINEQGRGEFTFNLENSEVDIKAIAMIHDKSVPLIGFKGNKIDNYEDILFAGKDNYEEDEYEYEYVEIEEYVEVDEDEDESDEEYEYVEVEEETEEEETIEIENKVHEFGYEEINNEKEYLKNVKMDKSIDEIQRSSKIQYVENNEDKKETKAPNMLLMPRQIKKGLKMFKEVKPFIEDYIENTRWWKIEISPMTMCGYSMPNLGYLNTLNYTMYSDIIMQSYKYRHYLFGVQYDEYSRRKNYIYAIPGKKEEQPDKGHTGFRSYQPCDVRNDNLGYWVCLIDSRSRKILK